MSKISKIIPTFLVTFSIAISLFAATSYGYDGTNGTSAVTEVASPKTNAIAPDAFVAQNDLNEKQSPDMPSAVAATNVATPKKATGDNLFSGPIGFWNTVVAGVRDVFSKIFSGDFEVAKTDPKKTDGLSSNSLQSTIQAGESSAVVKVSAGSCDGCRNCSNCFFDLCLGTCNDPEPTTRPTQAPDASACPGDCPYCGCNSDNSCDYTCDDGDSNGGGGGGSAGTAPAPPAGSPAFAACPGAGIRIQYANIGVANWFGAGADFAANTAVRSVAPYVAKGQDIRARVVDNNGVMLPIDNPTTTAVEGYKVKVQYDTSGAGGLGGFVGSTYDWYDLISSTSGGEKVGRISTVASGLDGYRATGLSKAKVWLENVPSCIGYSGYFITDNVCPPSGIKVQYKKDTAGEYYPSTVIPTPADMPRVVIGDTVMSRIIDGAGAPLDLNKYAIKVKFGHIEGTTTVWSSERLWNSEYPMQNPKLGTISQNPHGLHLGQWSAEISLLGGATTCKALSSYVVIAASDPANTPTSTPASAVTPSVTPTPTLTGARCASSAFCGVKQTCVGITATNTQGWCQTAKSWSPPPASTEPVCVVAESDAYCGNQYTCTGTGQTGNCFFTVCTTNATAGCVTPTPTLTPMPTLAPRDSNCAIDANCAQSLLCLTVSAGVTKCQQAQILGQPCRDDLRCGNKLTCRAGLCQLTALTSKGDANADGLVNDADLAIWRSEFLGSLGQDENRDGQLMDADFNGTSSVDLLDLWILLKNKI